MPLISICIPTFNMADFVGLAVKSALNQTYSDIEVIVCDNASEDNTQEVLAQFDDPRLKIFVNDSNIGAIGNFNLAIERATTEWVKFLEADDVLEPTCIERCVTFIDSDSKIDVVGVGRTRMEADGTPFLKEVHHTTEVISGETVRQRVHIRHNEFGTPSDVMVRKSLLEEVGGFDPDFGEYLNDWDLWLRCQEQAEKIAFIDESLVLVRRHPGQIGATGAKANIDIDVMFMMIAKRWGRPKLLSPLWRQRLRLELHLSILFFLRGLKQLVRGNMAFGVRRWDAFLRLINGLGFLKFLWVAGTSFFFYFLLRPHFQKRQIKSERIHDATM